MQTSDYPDNLLISKIPRALRDVTTWLNTQALSGTDAKITYVAGDGTPVNITINNVAHATAAEKSTGDKNGVDITKYLRSDVSITPSQDKAAAASGTPADLLAMILTKIKGLQGTTNFQDAIPATLDTLAGYFNSSGYALKAVAGDTQSSGDSSTKLATTAFVDSALSGSGFISNVVDSYDFSNTSAWWFKLKGTPGIIIQGGIISSTYRSSTTVSFPTAYSTAVLAVIQSAYTTNENSAGRGLDTVKSFSLTNFVSFTGFDMDHGMWWYSIGI